MGEIIFLILFIAYAFWILSTVMVVLLENRQPVKTIAWVVVLILLPVVGLVFFYFFGQNIRKERIIGKKSLDVLTQEALMEAQIGKSTEVPRNYQHIVRLFERHNMAALTTDNTLHIYTEGADFILGLFGAIARARHHVHLESYIIDDDAVGRMLRDLLISKVNEGVEVRLIYDDVGCWDVHNSFFQRMIDAGVKVGAFMPVRLPMFSHKINYRNHRKICVVDGQTGFIGGMNIANRYVRGQDGHRWRDMHLKVTGSGVAAIQRDFFVDWYFVTRVLITDPVYYPAPLHASGHAALQIVTADPVAHWPEFMYGLTWIIQNARRYIYIQTPYFMPTEPILQALQTAAMSGVDVRLMVPRKPDGFWLRWANDSYFKDILEAGIRLYTYRPGFLHSKALVADDEWCTIGSANMDFRSFENNFEANAFIYDHETAIKVKEIFREDAKGCKEIHLRSWNRRNYRRRLLESFTRIFSPLL